MPESNNVLSSPQTNETPTPPPTTEAPPPAASSLTSSVLVVGAGPTGLLLGIELLRRGISIRLVDQMTLPANTSRSIALHSRTMELFDILHLTDEILNHSRGINQMKYHFVSDIDEDEDDSAEGNNSRFKHTIELPFDSLEGRRPGVRIIPQNILESILRNEFRNLGGIVEWGTRVDHFVERDDKILVRFSTKVESCTFQGRFGTISQKTKDNFDYLIGCDGQRSSIRSILQLDFENCCSSSGMYLKMVDIPLNGLPSEFNEDALHYFIQKHQTISIVKYPAAIPEFEYRPNVYRVYVISHVEKIPDTSKASFHMAVQNVLPDVMLGDPLWISAYKIQNRKVRAYQSSKVFLAGDAAHVHCPIGGMGMNLCLGDGFNLGWKLALVCQRLTKSKDILDSYAGERSPIADQVLECADRVTELVLDHEWKNRAKDRFLDPERLVSIISGHAFTYAHDDLKFSFHQPFVRNKILQEGDYCPDLLVTTVTRGTTTATANTGTTSTTTTSSGDNSNLHYLSSIRAPYFILLLIDKTSSQQQQQQHDSKIVQLLETKSQSIFTVVKAFSNSPPKRFPSCFGIIIRPDRYIHCIIQRYCEFDDALKNLKQKYFLMDQF